MLKSRAFKIFMNWTCNAGVTYYRMINFAKYMRKENNVSLAYSDFDPKRGSIADWELNLHVAKETNDVDAQNRIIADMDMLMDVSDISIWQMVHTAASYSLFRAYRDKVKNKKMMLTEIDDYIFGVNPESLAYVSYHPNSDLETYAGWQIRNSHHVIVSTEYLKEKYKHLNESITVIPNAIDFDIWDKLKNAKKRGRVRIGWAGGGAHVTDLKVISKVMPIILEKYKNVDFVFFGGMPDYIKPSERVVHESAWYGIDDYPSELAKLGIDIGLAPLRDNQFNRAKCIVGNSFVNTINGIKQIENICDVREIDTFTPIKNDLFEAFYYGGVQDTIRIKTSMGYEIEGTITHRIKDLNNEWIELQKLKEGDMIKLSCFDIKLKKYNKIKFPLWLTYRVDYKNVDYDSSMLPEITLNEDWGRFIGYVIGDGHLTKTNGISVSSSEEYPLVLEDIERLYKKLGLNSFRVYKKNTHKEGNPISRSKAIDIRATSNHLLKFLNHINVSGRRLNEKIFRIPQAILTSPKSVIKEFLIGLFESDGTVDDKNSRIGITSKSIDLIKDIQYILLGFGIWGKIKHEWNRRYEKYYYTLILNREATDIYAKEIGFVSKKKKERLQKIIYKNHSNAFKLFNWTDAIISITKGRSEVFDISVPVTHTYNSNGFVSHNSNLRWLEYSALKIPTVASPVEPFNDKLYVGKHALEVNEWVHNLSELIEDRGERETLGQLAYDVVKTSFNVENVALDYLKVLKKLHKGKLGINSLIFDEESKGKMFTAHL